MGYMETEGNWKFYFQFVYFLAYLVGLGGLWVSYSLRDPRFVGSNPAEVDRLFQDVKVLSTSTPGGTLSRWSRVSDFRLSKL